MPIHLARRISLRETSARYETLYTRDSLGQPEASDVRVVDDGGPYADKDGAGWRGSRVHC